MVDFFPQLNLGARFAVMRRACVFMGQVRARRSNDLTNFGSDRCNARSISSTDRWRCFCKEKWSFISCILGNTWMGLG